MFADDAGCKEMGWAFEVTTDGAWQTALDTCDLLECWVTCHRECVLVACICSRAFISAFLSSEERVCKEYLKQSSTLRNSRLVWRTDDRCAYSEMIYWWSNEVEALSWSRWRHRLSLTRIQDEASCGSDFVAHTHGYTCPAVSGAGQ